jgi:serine/threonine-protein kinase
MVSSDDSDVDPHADAGSLPPSSLGSGLLAQHSTPSGAETIAVAKVCPQCGNEYLTSDRFCPRDGSPLRPKAGNDPLIGRVIADRYLMLARLGEGGMGRVYLAEHVKMTRQCAIKVMNPSLINDTESATRFAREASNAARILHPNVAAVFDYGEADKIVYLVMEYVDGESLSAIIRREGALDPRRAVDIARQVADGLAAAHELGIIHRDLKPDNVIVARSRSHREIPKVVDFGIAKAMSESPQDALTRSGPVIGTPEYMSPEQLLGDPVDARADVYSLGCILYQMLTGQPAFAADTREQMIRRRLHEAPPHIRDVMPELPARLDTVIAHMLARSSGDRLGSAAEARDALNPALVFAGWEPGESAGPRARPQLQLTSAGFSVHPSLQPTLRMPEQRKSNAPRIAAGIVVVGAIVGLGGVLYWSQQGASSANSADTTKAPVAIAADSLPAVAPKELPRLDSASAAREKKAADSAAALRAAEVEMRAPLERYAKAFAKDNLEAVIQTFPEMPDGLRSQLRRFFDGAEHITANPIYGAATTTDDKSELRFSVRLRFTTPNSPQPTTSVLNYHAVLAKRGGKWEIAELRPE